MMFGHDFWVNSQLSIARHYGAIKFNGIVYIIVGDSFDLVRIDLLQNYIDNPDAFIENAKSSGNVSIYNETLATLIINNIQLRNDEFSPGSLPNVEEMEGSVRVVIPARKF